MVLLGWVPMYLHTPPLSPHLCGRFLSDDSRAPMGPQTHWAATPVFAIGASHPSESKSVPSLAALVRLLRGILRAPLRDYLHPSFHAGMSGYADHIRNTDIARTRASLSLLTTTSPARSVRFL